MIRKQTVFIDYNVQHVGFRARHMTRKLESDLAQLAADISMNEGGGNPPHLAMEDIFEARKVRGHTLDWETSGAFTLAAFNAHRTESLLVAELSDVHNTRYDRLKLCIRFFHKEERKPFFEWSMTFNFDFILLQSGITGHGKLGEHVTEKC